MSRKENMVLVLEATSLLAYFAILIIGITFAIDEKTVIVCCGVMAIACMLLRVKWIKPHCSGEENG